MKLLPKILLCISLLLLLTKLSKAQNGQTKIDYASYPVWISMMDDPKINYFEAVKAYEEYWKHHVKPKSEEEEMEEGDVSPGERLRESKQAVRKDKNVVLTEEEIKKKNENDRMKYQVKRFEQWMREVKPFVQEDGHILSDQERMEIWKRQQEEINKQKK